MSKRLAIFPTESRLYPKAIELAKALSFPIIFEANREFDYWIILKDDFLGIKECHSNAHVLKVDFLTQKIDYRLKHASLKKEALAKAIGIHPNKNPFILDATGGLGQDSIVLSYLGYSITVLERVPLMYYLLQDGLRRALPVLPCVSRIQLIHQNAITW